MRGVSRARLELSTYRLEWWNATRVPVALSKLLSQLMSVLHAPWQKERLLIMVERSDVGNLGHNCHFPEAFQATTKMSSGRSPARNAQRARRPCFWAPSQDRVSPVQL